MNQKTVIYILTDRDGLDVRTYAMLVHTELDTKRLEQAIKAASQEYLNTDAGRKLWDDNCGNFNYGDFMAYIPADICVRHGFTILRGVQDDFCVVQDDYNTTLAEPEVQDEPSDDEKKGYAVTDNMGMLEIQRIDELGIFPDDESAVEQAVKDGVKLIPVEELPKNFERRYLGWIDTPENRAAIQAFCDMTARKGNTNDKTDR